MQKSASWLFHVKTTLEILVHIFVEKAENLQFEREVRPFVWIRDMTVDQDNHQQAPSIQFINRRLRYILGVFWPRNLSNDDLWPRTKQERVEVTIRRRKWKWIDHSLRKPVTNITRQALEWNPQGARKRGRPRKSWRRTIKQEYEDTGISWEQVKRTAQNRVRWRRTVEALCSGRSGED